MTKTKNKTITETKDISFNPQEMEPRWQKKWEADKLYRSVIDEIMTVADKGTLFLDEIAEMSPKTQVKLLRVIEERTVLPLGGTEPVPFDARIIAATNRDMERDIASGALREDLYYRLNVIPLEVPPLRERKEDIPLLAGYFLAKYSSRMGKDVRGISPQAQDTLLRHDWPGNVRELENVIQRYVALADGPTIGEIEIRSTRARDRPPPPEGVAIPEGGIDLEALVSAHERRYLEAALARGNGMLAWATVDYVMVRDRYPHAGDHAGGWETSHCTSVARSWSTPAARLVSWGTRQMSNEGRLLASTFLLISRMHPRGDLMICVRMRLFSDNFR